MHRLISRARATDVSKQSYVLALYLLPYRNDSFARSPVSSFLNQKAYFRLLGDRRVLIPEKVPRFIRDTRRCALPPSIVRREITGISVGIGICIVAIKLPL